MNWKAIFGAAIAGTSVMTAFSYLVARKKNKNFREPQLLGSLLRSSMPPLKKQPAGIAGWSIHYAIGVLWTVIYAAVKNENKKPSASAVTAFGMISGLTGIMSWKIFFKTNSDPPVTDYREFYTQLFIAHFIFSATMAGMYSAIGRTGNGRHRGDKMPYDRENGLSTYMSPEIRCLEIIQQKGFTDQFKPAGLSLLCVNNGHTYQPEEVSIVNFYRFEGISDPDDMSIIYVIETSDGRRGTLTDAYGIYADNSVGTFMKKVQNFHKQTSEPWQVKG